MNLLLHGLRRMYAAFLLLLPGDVRARHGDEMRATSRELVEDTLRRRGTAAALAAGVAECADVLRAAARMSRQAPSEFRQDLAYAWRLMWARPGFTAAVVATLAIGIAATTTVFTVVNALLLRPLPYAEPERLVQLSATSQRAVSISFSPRDFLDISAQARSIESATAFTVDELNLTGNNEPERVTGASVTWQFFDVIGSRPILGRSFVAAEGQDGSQRVAVISDGLWRRRFGGDPSIVGRDITLDGRPYLVVGVADATLMFPGRPDVWRPLVFTPHQVDASQRGARWIQVIARLKPEVSVETARAEIATIAERFARDFARTHRGRGSRVVSLQEALVGPTRRGLLAMFGAMALVLLIGCANVANLLLARSAARRGEMQMRLALGATRTRLLRQYLVENLLLTIVAAAIGLGLAAWGTRAAVSLVPSGLPRVNEISVDLRVAGFGVATAVLLALILGAVAALGIGRQSAIISTRTTPAGARFVRRSLVVAEVAMALVLLTAAGLFVKSLSRLYSVPPGFDPYGVLTFSVALPSASYPEPEDLTRFLDRAREEFSSRPGVQAAAIFGLPLTETNAASTFDQIGKKTDPDNEPFALMRVASPGYFGVMRIPFSSGRDFSAADTAAAPGVAIVNETAARKYWPGENPVGQSIKLHAGISSVGQTPRQVVGVVGDVRFDGLDVEPRPEVYIPFAQHPVDVLLMAVRTEGDPRALAGDARAIVRRLDPNMPIAAVATMEELLAGSVAARRFSLMLLAAFAVTALVLAAIGIYGVLSYTVGQRTKEIGVRMAMGAARAQVLRIVVGEGMMLAVAGLVIGIAATLATTRLIAGLLYGVQPYDPATLASVGAALVAVALAASYLPARRAASVNPVAALRTE